MCGCRYRCGYGCGCEFACPYLFVFYHAFQNNPNSYAYFKHTRLHLAKHSIHHFYVLLGGCDRPPSVLMGRTSLPRNYAVKGFVLRGAAWQSE